MDLVIARVSDGMITKQHVFYTYST